MARLTLLDMTQRCLRHIASDKVNSINDTEESVDVANLIRDVYFDMMANSDWPHLRDAINLTGLGDTARPTHMKIEDNFQKIDNETVWYDVRELATNDPTYRNITYLEPDEFLLKILPRASHLSNDNTVQITDPVRLYILNDTGPTVCTSFDDETIIFDAFDSAVDTTLTGTKVNAMGYREPSLVLADSTIPDLPSKNFPELLAECKSVVSITVAQEPDRKQEQIATRLRNRSEREKWRTRGGIRFPEHYGRK